MIRIVAIILMAVMGVAESMASYTTVSGRLDHSKIYPGTIHTFTVTVPDQYSPETPAALYVGLDGILCNAPQVIDSLTRAGAMPVTIGVFLQPGTIARADGSVVRYNRSNEFDATDARFATFLETELLPAVEALATADGRDIRLSNDPALRMIFGLSSGGIAAFNAVWHRPDMFSKVYTGCGTFVPMRGGNDLQAIVRKHEPLPVRFFLQDGYSDTWNPTFGSWYEANLMLASALKFAGYDVDTDWAEGGHSVVRTSKIFPRVMEWMWRDCPEPITPGRTGNVLLDTLLRDSSPWEYAETDIVAVFGTDRAFYPDSSLMAAANPGSNYIDQYIVASDGSLTDRQRFYWLHTYDNSALDINSMAFDANGYLWVLTRAGIQICDQNGRVRGILRLPLGFDADHGSIAVGDGRVVIRDGSGTFTRRLNAKSPTPGIRPKSEGSA